MDSTGDAIREARNALGLSRSDLARSAGVSERTINRVESGQTVSDRSLQPLLRYLHLGEYANTGGPSLADASHTELLAELARRLDVALPHERRRPPIPDTELEWPMSSAPSQRNRTDPDEPGNAGHSTK